MKRKAACKLNGLMFSANLALNRAVKFYGFQFSRLRDRKAPLCLSLELCREHQILMSTWCALRVLGEDVCYRNKLPLLSWSFLLCCGVINSTKVTVAAVLEVGPDDVFLREAEYAKSASAHGGVYGDPRVSYQLRAFIEPHPTDSAGVCGESPMDSSRSLPSESSSSPGQEPNVHVSLTRL